jgi:hypothetical protein
MSITDSWAKMPENYDELSAFKLLDQMSLILTKMLPGSTPRRYDLAAPPDHDWPIEVCFANHGPIVPRLRFTCNKYYTRTGLYICYQMMFRNALDLNTAMSGPKIQGSARFDSGPQAMAETLHQAIIKDDLPAMIAEGRIDRIVAERPRLAVPWPNIYLAQCAVYIGEYDEARELLNNALEYAFQDGRPGYADAIAEAKDSLAKLNSDADGLRAQLMGVTEYNWSHFKVVDQ